MVLMNTDPVLLSLWLRELVKLNNHSTCEGTKKHIKKNEM